jgi:unsaturated chondroitin disaccharide hydrolase
MSSLPPFSPAAAIDAALVKIDANLVPFARLCPDDTTINNVYYPRRRPGKFPDGANTGWTTGFWPGLLWLAYEWTGDDKYRRAAEVQMESFAERMANKIDVDHHDLGFLYSLTAVAAYRLTGSQSARELGLETARTLMNRFWEKPGIIQAWGRMDDPDQKGRTIVDSLMNLPLWYWASETTGDPSYYHAGLRHARQLQRYFVRPDNTTYHTYYFDTETGEARFGKTAQGAADESCWARGQAWAIYGFPLSYAYSKDATFLDTASRLADYFIDHIPADHVVYWDLAFGDGSGEEKDSSASAIAACGFLELAKGLPEGAQKEKYTQAALRSVEALATHYTSRDLPESNALILHGVYSKPAGHGVDEANLWGDYFYLEALMRLARPNWNMYW